MQVTPHPQSAQGAAHPAAGESAPPARDRRPLHDALKLTEGGVLADIHLHGQIYSLRITRAGKLILTK